VLQNNFAIMKCLLLKTPIKRMMKNLQLEIMVLDDFDEWCSMPQGELLNHIAWWFKKYANFTDYIDQDQYLSSYNDSKYIQYSLPRSLVSLFQSDEQAGYIVYPLDPYGKEHISHQEMIQRFSESG